MLVSMSTVTTLDISYTIQGILWNIASIVLDLIIVCFSGIRAPV